MSGNTALLLTALLGVVLYCENYFNNNYYQSSLKMIKERQNDISETQMQRWAMFSAIGSGYAFLFYYLCFCVYTGINQLHRVAYYGVFFAPVGFTMNMSKMYFQQWRPFELEAEIRMGDNSCPKEYGNPSGHSMFAPAFGGLVLLDILTTCIKLKSVQQIVISVLSAIFYFLIAYSRMVLGVHALNQVIFGMILGIWLALAYHLMVRNIMFGYISKTVYQSDNVNKASAGVDFLMALFFMLDLIFIQFCLYYYVEQSEQVPGGVLANVKAKCPDFDPNNHFIRATKEHIWISGMGFLFFAYVVMVKQFFPHGFGAFPAFMGLASLLE